jgi:hypothetical protein
VALKVCPDCGDGLSAEAKACSHCGHGLTTSLALPGKRKQFWMRLLLAVALHGVVLVPLIIVAVTDNETPAQPANLTADVRAQIVGTGPSQFGARGVARVVCDPPSSWSTGDTFTCFAYGNSDRALGTYYGTVEPTRGSDVRWKARWVLGPQARSVPGPSTS